MEKYRIYKANAKNENQEFIKANQLDWQPTDLVIESYDEAYTHKCDSQLIDEWHYYKIVKEE